MDPWQAIGPCHVGCHGPTIIDTNESFAVSLPPAPSVRQSVSLAIVVVVLVVVVIDVVIVVVVVFLGSKRKPPVKIASLS